MFASVAHMGLKATFVKTPPRLALNFRGSIWKSVPSPWHSTFKLRVDVNTNNR